MQMLIQLTHVTMAMSPLVGFVQGLLVYLGPPLLVVFLWKKLRLKPSGRMINYAWVWLVMGVIASFIPELSLLWWGVLWFWLAVAAVDAVLVFLVKPLTVERKLPGRFAIGVESEVSLSVRHHSSQNIRLTVYDGLPEAGMSDGMPWKGVLKGNSTVKISYPLVINQRGEAELEPAHIQYDSLLRFWTRQVRAGDRQTTKVYPNYEPVVRFALLTMENRVEQMGIRMKNRAGISKEFHQLRDYQLGDMLSQVDWKATSKKCQIISRDYQEQRDQTLILAIDCGQRMRTLDGEISQFDHCLNAMLLMAYVALRQGDQVGVMSYGGQERWLPPQKGVQAMTTILNHLYDYKTSSSPSDYVEAAERVLVRQRRRALVVFLTNIRGEDGDELIEPLRGLRSKHVVMLANLREKDVMDKLAVPVATLDDATLVAAGHLYMKSRSQVLEELRSHGIHTVDATAQDLPVALANHYRVVREGV